MFTRGPSKGERYYLRLLLLHVKGARCYEDLRTHNNVIFNTFKEAANSRGLLPNDNEWDKCLNEAVSIKLPSTLRNLFASICVFSHPTNPLELFLKYKEQLIEDFLFQTKDNILATNKCLIQFEKYFKLHGKSCSSFQLPAPDTSLEFDEPFDINFEKTLADGLYKQLNQNQLYVVDTILNSIENYKKENENAYFIDGPGGTGKTTCYNTLTRILRSKAKNVISVAWTGIAATLLIENKKIVK